MNIWLAVYAAAATLLALYSRGQNAVWGGATAGLIIGLGVAFFDTGADWWVALKGASIGALAGVAADMLGRAGDRLKG